jgi:nicotinate phosphoribosyltransferase
MGGGRGRRRPAPLGSLALLTDLYELTMAQGFWRAGRASDEAVFHLTFRTHPFGSGFTVACGLAPAVEYVEGFRFTDDDVRHLAGLCDPHGGRLFDDGFLGTLRDLALEVDIEAVPEGTVVFPHEPLLRVRGPLFHCQLLETSLLTIVNFQTLIATKAARVRLAAGDDAILELGLRRAHGVDGGVAASRAAYVGGCTATSNVLAGRRYGIPVRGTHAHSWVMAFESEVQAFEAWATAMPGSAVLLVDTYDSVSGVRRAIDVGRQLRAAGFELAGVRLDSGDLVALSRRARRLLDEADFAQTEIVASGDLDEHRIAALKRAGAQVNVWGVGTRLVTAHDDPALTGVYKLSAVRARGKAWRYPEKRSEQSEKRSMPGILQVLRYARGGTFTGDAIVAEGEKTGPSIEVMTVSVPGRRLAVAGDGKPARLLVPAVRGGRAAGPAESLATVRARVTAQIAALPEGCRQLRQPVVYPVGVSPGVRALRATR